MCYIIRKEVKTPKKKGINDMSIVDLLTVAFVVLKLVGVITWPWVWVLAPIWICILFWMIVGVIKKL